MLFPDSDHSIENGSRIPGCMHRGRRTRRGITLIEMLIAVTLTLLIMFAVVRVFELMGNSLNDGRAAIEMAGQLRSATNQLQRDLDGITVPTLPWVNPDSALGYFEYIEGRGNDRDSDADQVDDQIDDLVQGNVRDTSIGDIDDVLMFTARSHGEPFVGRFLGQLIESQVAEVVWWVQFEDVDGDGIRGPSESQIPFILRRRVLLVRPDLDLQLRQVAVGTEAELIEFFNNNDISARPNTVTSSGVMANSLSDLSKRENRFAHLKFATDGSNFPVNFPYPLNRAWLVPKYGEFLGEDVVLTDVLAFDVRAFDPRAPIDLTNASVAMLPGDPGYNYQTALTSSVARGAYVDLNYANDGSTPLVGSFFSGPPNLNRRAMAQLIGRFPNSLVFYDTWPDHYERNGLNEDSHLDADQGTNGLDDIDQNARTYVGGVDDVGERETAAPYGVPLRGIEVRLRVMDFDSRQVRQVSVVGDFVRE